MTRPEEIELLAERAADKAIQRFFQVLGVDASDPIEMQKDFAHLRSWRQAIEQTKSHTLTAAIGIILTGIAGAVWAVMTHKFP